MIEESLFITWALWVKLPWCMFRRLGISLLKEAVIKAWVNRQERLQPRNEKACEVYLGSRARAWAKARAIVFSRAIIFWRLESFLPIDPKARPSLCFLEVKRVSQFATRNSRLHLILVLHFIKNINSQ